MDSGAVRRCQSRKVKKKKKTIKERKRKKKEKENLKESMVVQKGEMRQEWDRSKLSNEKRKSEM